MTTTTKCPPCQHRDELAWIRKEIEYAQARAEYLGVRSLYWVLGNLTREIDKFIAEDEPCRCAL